MAKGIIIVGACVPMGAFATNHDAMVVKSLDEISQPEPLKITNYRRLDIDYPPEVYLKPQSKFHK